MKKAKHSPFSPIPHQFFIFPGKTNRTIHDNHIIFHVLSLEQLRNYIFQRGGHQRFGTLELVFHIFWIFGDLVGNSQHVFVVHFYNVQGRVEICWIQMKVVSVEKKTYEYSITLFLFRQLSEKEIE